MNKKINLLLENINLNNVIHVGAGIGDYVKHYQDLNVRQIIWIEKQETLYKNLYDNTCFVPIKQNYYFADLHKENIENKITFKTLWRKYSYDIDIERYQTLVVNVRNGLDVVEGFENFKTNFDYIIFLKPNGNEQQYMNSIGYELEIYTNQALYKRV